MDRLAEHIVAWHNRHPLARRISVDDVHTIGVVALPFYRASAQGGGLVEPVLTDEVRPEDIAATPAQAPDAADASQAQPVDTQAEAAAAPQAEPTATPPADSPSTASTAAPGAQVPAASALTATPKPSLLQRLLALLPQRKTDEWAGFDEDLLEGLSPARIARFALANGFTEPPPGSTELPSRQVETEPALAEGGWPYTLYLLSAAIDAGPKRTRVIAGRGNPPQLAGRRLLDPRRLGAAAAIGAALIAVLAWLAWPHAPAAESGTEPASAASAASATSATASMPATADSAEQAPSAPLLAASGAASGTDGAALPVPGAASGTVSAGAESPGGSASAAASQPDIRPQLVDRGGRATPALGSALPRGSEAATDSHGRESPASNPAEKEPAQGSRKTPTPGNAKDAKPEPGTNREAREEVQRLGQQGPRVVVALVGPAGTKEEAEAHLKKMREVLAEVDGQPDRLQADVVKSASGWRATIWPFETREQAQLVNAFMIARGLKTRAVNF